MRKESTTFMEKAKAQFHKESDKKGYREPEGSTFTHDGRKYDLNKVLEEIESQRNYTFNVSDLDWVLKYDKPKADRVDKADTSTPIIVHEWNGKLVAVDGLHRLAKARRDGEKTIRGKYVYDKQLERSRV